MHVGGNDNQNQWKKGGEAQVPGKCKEWFSQRNGHAGVEENDSKDTLVLYDDAHKVNLHTHSYFICMR